MPKIPRSLPEDVCLGVALRRLRRGRNITQAELAERVGCSYQQIQKYEIGCNRVAFSTFLRLADGLGISSAELLREAEAERPDRRQG